MPEALELWEQPEKRPLVMIAGWQQWADAGSLSSGLPQYLIQETGARKIGTIKPDGFYLFQIPGTHDLVRPVVKFDDGYPEALKTQSNDLYYTEMGERGVVFFMGEEPHLDVERYSELFLDAGQKLGVERIVSVAGVYGELPYNKERSVSCIYSLQSMKDEFERLAVNLSDYHGGASIGSYLCRRAGDRDMPYVGMYAFVPTYNFSNLQQVSNAIHIENDFMGWLGVMRRINFMLKTTFDLGDLERKSQRLVEVLDAKIDELESVTPGAGIREYFKELEDEFTEVLFDPLDDVWEDEIRRLFDDPEA
ncbi:MAG: PAC2 family protein [Chloroflexi bacterium]|nr:PAC2 family protein [Chloroflexota bacterium]